MTNSGNFKVAIRGFAMKRKKKSLKMFTKLAVDIYKLKFTVVKSKLSKQNLETATKPGCVALKDQWRQHLLCLS